MEEVEIIGKTNDSNDDKSEKNDSVEVYVFVLFDGTNNNMYNIETYRKLNDEKHLKGIKRFFAKVKRPSSKQEFSNVARLSKICKEKVSSSKWVSYVYVDGIGTSTTWDSPLAGDGLGVGDLGVEAKVQKGCELVVQSINRMAEESGKNCDITLNLAATGFSRGAAAARRFVSCVNERKGGQSPYDVCLSNHLNKSLCPEVCLSGDIKVPILGVFDTVSSYGVKKTLVSSFKMLPKETLQKYADNVKELSLNELGNAENTFQLCAADEYRLHFGLTKLPDDDNNYTIPGCHSDIGGGYVDNKVEKYSVKFIKEKYEMVRLGNGNKTKEELLDEGWFTETDLAIGARVVSNKYSFIPFTYMLEKVFKEHLSSVKSILFDDGARAKEKFGKEAWESDDGLEADEKAVLNEFLGMVMSKKKFYSSPKKPKYLLGNMDRLRFLRNKFIHLSSKFSLTNMASPDNERIVM